MTLLDTVTAILQTVDKSALIARAAAADVKLDAARKKLAEVDEDHITCQDCEDRWNEARDLVKEARRALRGQL